MCERRPSPAAAAMTGPLYLVTDSGVLFGMHDENTAKLLGVQGDPVPAPWPVLSRLPRGPELSRDSALVARDSVALAAVTGRARPSSPPRQPRRRRRSRRRRMRFVARLDPAGYRLPVVRSGVRRRR